MTTETKCTDGGEHDFSDEREDRNEAGEVVGTLFVCSKCGKRISEVAEEEG